MLNKKDGKTIYNYDIQNFTASHVHMLLSTTLNDIIHSTECVIFLNTPESLSINEVRNQKTNSPWIYNELKIASIVEKIYPRKHLLGEQIMKRENNFSKKVQNSLEILYPISNQLAGFESLDSNGLQKWVVNKSMWEANFHPLDILYSGVGI